MMSIIHAIRTTTIHAVTSLCRPSKSGGYWNDFTVFCSPPWLASNCLSQLELKRNNSDIEIGRLKRRPACSSNVLIPRRVLASLGSMYCFYPFKIWLVKNRSSHQIWGLQPRYSPIISLFLFFEEDSRYSKIGKSTVNMDLSRYADSHLFKNIGFFICIIVRISCVFHLDEYSIQDFSFLSFALESKELQNIKTWYKVWHICYRIQ